ncbi:hypothetical protein [Spiroplasma endosymbiont of Notiophilus biguttatus]|uniref:hypothetical protein n=1 Tax=Spiroplasma endosymbiont of Notiophilus biguttatus TaxID=3066285 RepID=UPI00313D1293
MFIPFITTVMHLFASIFMKFFSFPLGDLGFNLGTLMIFLILLRFAFRVILPELMLPTLDLGQNVKTMGRASVKFYKGSSWVGKQIAKGHKQTQDVSGINVGN